VEHLRFPDLEGLLEPGDLLVLNTSRTLPAALDAHRADGSEVPVHLSTRLDDGDWVVELRRSDASGPDLTGRPGEEIRLPGDVLLRLRTPYPDPSPGSPPRLWRARPRPAVEPEGYLGRHGRPIGYGYLAGRFPLKDHQTVYARQPGSAELVSAGRPFTTDLLVRLMTVGVTVAPLVLHTGVSSPEAQEPPSPERYQVPPATARLVRSARSAGRRIVAVGTSVVRALETVAGADGTVRAGQGWTDLVLGPERPARVVTGLLTGLHAPGASHLLLLEAIAGAELVQVAYRAAVSERYLWHEFGDSMLFLP
jgi:S-adenosylmethionine:tRNA ribosyltransferase-isomerase